MTGGALLCLRLFVRPAIGCGERLPAAWRSPVFAPCEEVPDLQTSAAGLVDGHRRGLRCVFRRLVLGLRNAPGRVSWHQQKKKKNAPTNRVGAMFMRLSRLLDGKTGA